MKKAIVIGASSGIGRELARLLSADDYRIAIVARRISLLNEFQSELPSKTLVKQLDVANTNDSIRVMSELIVEMDGVSYCIRCRCWRAKC